MVGSRKPGAGSPIARAHTGTPRAASRSGGGDVVEVGERADPAPRSRVGAAGVGRGRVAQVLAREQVAARREVGRRAREAEARGVFLATTSTTSRSSSTPLAAAASRSSSSPSPCDGRARLNR